MKSSTFHAILDICIPSLAFVQSSAFYVWGAVWRARDVKGVYKTNKTKQQQKIVLMKLMSK